MAACMLHGLCFGEEAGARNLVFFRVKWLQPAIRLWSCNFRRHCAYFYCVLQLSLCRWHCSGCVKVAWRSGCMRNTIFFCSWRSYIVLENGCIKAAKVNCQQIFSILGLIIFLLKFLLKSASKSSFCRFGVEIRFWSCNFRRHCAYFYCFATQSLQMAL